MSSGMRTIVQITLSWLGCRRILDICPPIMSPGQKAIHSPKVAATTNIQLLLVVCLVAR